MYFVFVHSANSSAFILECVTNWLLTISYKTRNEPRWFAEENISLIVYGRGSLASVLQFFRLQALGLVLALE